MIHIINIKYLFLDLEYQVCSFNFYLHPFSLFDPLRDNLFGERIDEISLQCPVDRTSPVRRIPSFLGQIILRFISEAQRDLVGRIDQFGLFFDLDFEDILEHIGDDRIEDDAFIHPIEKFRTEKSLEHRLQFLLQLLSQAFMII